jgi:hypothetical protein
LLKLINSGRSCSKLVLPAKPLAMFSEVDVLENPGNNIIAPG